MSSPFGIRASSPIPNGQHKRYVIKPCTSWRTWSADLDGARKKCGGDLLVTGKQTKRINEW